MKTDCCCQPSTETCGCCEGVETLTPLPTANRPGLPQLSYRIGTHAAFLETMKARLASSDYPKLADLKTRTSGDPSIAMLDAWSTVADVLTFYQERIANEGYLRTATERRSILEMGRLIGYQPRPGVSASVYLAYTVDDNFKEETVIPKGAKAQSIPGPGELPQTFETSEDLKARASWNKLKPRMSRPQNIKLASALIQKELYLDGIATNLKTNDRILMVFGSEPSKQVMRHVKEVLPQSEFQRTRVMLQTLPYLVTGLTALLNNALIELSKQKTNSEIAAKYYHLVSLCIENIHLDNYPPLMPEYFSRRNLYRLLSGDPEIIGELSAFIPREPDQLTPFKITVWKAIQDTQSTLDISKLFWSSILIKLGELLKYDEDFRSNILAFLIHLAEQLNPNSSDDKQELGIFFHELDSELKDKNINDWIDNQWNNLINDIGNEVENVFWPEVINLLRGQTLQKALTNLLSGLEELYIVLKPESGSGPGKLINLIKVKEVAVELNKRLNTIPPITAPTISINYNIVTLISSLNIPKIPQLPNSLHLPRTIKKLQDNSSDAIPQLLVNFAPALKLTLYPALARADVETDESELQAVYAFRLSASLFGNNAPRTPIFDQETGAVSEMQEWEPARDEQPSILFLDNEYNGIVPESYVVIRKPSGQMIARHVISVATTNRSEYNLTGKSTGIRISEPWRLPPSASLLLDIARELPSTNSPLPPVHSELSQNSDFSLIRQSIVFAQSELLNIAEEPISDNLCPPGSGKSEVEKMELELDSLVEGLKEGQWLIISGERTDVAGTSGVTANELVMIDDVRQNFDKALPGDKNHSFITLAKPLTYCYKRDTVTIYGNVVKATHGETRKEVLGSGDGAKALQSFILKQPPLTFVSAPNSSGIDSTLKVFVNDIKWQETNTLTGLSATDRNFITKTDDDGKTTVIFGNGREGARLPTGIENIKAEYRNGIGKSGNVKTEQISLLTTRPLGVKEVINPMRASGGADKETRDQARKNVPLAVMALDRLVSVQDYEDFSRLYAGIGKASAIEISDGRRQVVHITIAGLDDIPLDKDSDLYRNLYRSLLDFGDPYQPIQLEIRELMYVVVSAGIRIKSEYQWEPVVIQIRAVLLDTFSFDRRELGQDVLLSEIVSSIQNVKGVEYVDLNTFGGIPEKKLDADVRRLLTPEEISKIVTDLVNKPVPRLQVNLAGYKDKDGNIKSVLHPAQIAFITPEVPETLILNQII